MTANKFKTACIQVNVGDDVEANIRHVSGFVREAAGKGADFITLPENVAMMPKDARELFAKSFHEKEHPAFAAFKNLAKELGKWLLIGSLAIRTEGQDKLVNRSYLIDPDGKVAEHYDKIHLYDVELGNGEVYRESQSYMSGKNMKKAKLPWGTLGMTICYDVRFPHLYRGLAKAGADFITVPAAFVKFTGRDHWHTLLRARAIENGCFIIAPALTGKHPSGRETFGHSQIIDPWGHILAEAKEEEAIIYADIDRARVDEVRKTMPSLIHDREFDF